MGSRSSSTTSARRAPRRISIWRRSSWIMKRKALGKGLRSLIPDGPRPTRPDAPAAPGAPATQALGPARFPQVDLDQIVPNHLQPREDFDASALEALAQSLKAEGVLQPVLVRPLADGRFGLVAGER